jgi:hypothetical protein
MMIVADSSIARPKRTMRPSSGNFITVPTSRFLCHRPEHDAQMRGNGTLAIKRYARLTLC